MLMTHSLPVMVIWDEGTSHQPPTKIQKIKFDRVIEQDTQPAIFNAQINLGKEEFRLEAGKLGGPAQQQAWNELLGTKFGKSVGWLNDDYIGKTITAVEVKPNGEMLTDLTIYVG